MSSDIYEKTPKKVTYRLIEAAQKGDEEALEKVVCGNAGLVKSVAARFSGMGRELDDLIQIGYIGLVKAVKRFDVSYDVMFSTYAVPMIIGEIKRYIRDDGKIKIGRTIRQDIVRLKSARDEFLAKNGEYPRISQLGEMLEISGEKVLELLEAEKASASIESIDSEDYVEGSSNDSVSDFAEKENMHAYMISIKSALDELPKTERQLIALRYFRDFTQAQTAKVLGMSQVQVSRMEHKILDKIRDTMGQ